MLDRMGNSSEPADVVWIVDGLNVFDCVYDAWAVNESNCD